MKLDKFLSETLRGIVARVTDANQKLGGGGNEKFVIYSKDENAIEFDVAVTVSDGKTEVAEGSFGVGSNFFGLHLGGNQQNSKSDKTVSRIKFRVKPRLHIK